MLGWVVPYFKLARLDKPQGGFLIFWAFAWGLTMAAYRSDLALKSYASLLLRCLVGAFLYRGTGVTFNDICDRKLDRLVERTKNRPIASGVISVKSAAVFLVLQIILCIAAFWPLNTPALVALLIGIFPLAGAYPFMKRITYWPQAWLGIAGNWGLIIAWLAIFPSLDYSLISSLMAGMCCWTLLYDTIYACQDKSDDMKAGAKSTAILFGSYVKPLLTGFGAIFIAMMFYSGVINRQGGFYFFFSVGMAAVHVTWQIYSVDLENKASCWANFRRNSQLGWIIWVGMVLDYTCTRRSAI
ncbi:4-hydroxybenzoate polyprenyl transferase [Infundibulicybe gibba]|nr:4-hydroxybenzoate polyprenyl transferase [Infundibulicybe gibba]